LMPDGWTFRFKYGIKRIPVCREVCKGEQRHEKILFVLVLLFFAGMVAFSGYKVYTILAEYREGEDAAQMLRQYITVQPEKTDSAEAVAVSSEPTSQNWNYVEPTEVALPAETSVDYPVVDFDALQEINPDVLGWIFFEGTNINYPVVQGADNNYYLNHLVDGTVNGAGSIFMDYRNVPDFSDFNTVIYGHNMKNKTMFADITEYKNSTFYEAHQLGKIMTPQGNFQIQVIGGYVADLRDPAWQIHFETEEAFQDWLRDAMKRSEVGGEYEPEAGERIITLSTCSYEFEDARFVLICRVTDTPGKDE